MPVNVATAEETTALANKIAALEGRVSKLEGAIQPPDAIKSSPDGTVVTPGVGMITDSTGHTWTVTVGGQVIRDGITDNTTSAVAQLGWFAGVIWQENTAHRCWSTPPVWPTTWQPAGGVPTTQSPFQQIKA